MSALVTGQLLESVPCNRLVTELTTFANCVVERASSRDVHYPNLNACFVHENYSSSFQCRTVHFGYAIPVIVYSSDRDSSVEIVFDGDASLDPRAAAYLLEHHPQLVAFADSLSSREDNFIPGAGQSESITYHPLYPSTTPNPTLSTPFYPHPSENTFSKLATFQAADIRSHRRSEPQRSLTETSPSSSGKMPVDPNELYDQLMRQSSAEQDIKAIAKQISDHAEVIYQTWKSKGLTPNELLQLHSVGSVISESNSDSHSSNKGVAVNGHNKTPVQATVSTGPYRLQQQHGRMPSDRPKSGPPLSPVDLLASPRLEATLEELVNSFVQEDKARLAARGRTSSPSPTVPGFKTTPVVPSFSPIQTALKRFEKKGVNYETARSTSAGRLPETTSMSSKPVERPSSAIETHVPVSLKPSTTFQEAVQSASRPLEDPNSSAETVKSRAKKFASRIEMANASGLTTWPLKRNMPAQSEKKPVIVTEVFHEVAAAPNTGGPGTLPLKMSEVDKEEEKLINALKTGELIEEVAPSEEFLVKKSRERQRDTHRLPKPTVAEEELETLVDRLKSLDSTESPSKPAALGRESSPLTVREESPSRSTSPRSTKLSDTVPVTGVSTVDYAKVRFQAAQANPLTQQRLEDSRTIGKATNAPQPNVVSETRSRFENSLTRSPHWRTDWSPNRLQQEEIKAPLTEIVAEQPSQYANQTVNVTVGPVSPDLLRRKSRKLRKSPEPGTGSNGSSPSSSPLPHPELTVQQRQHLRERNLQQQSMIAQNNSVTGPGTVQYTASGIPIRPFLTRGSVAERVLIFEKCPTAIEPKEKSSVLSSSLADKKRALPTASSNTWRHAADVQTKTQVYAKDNNKENRSSSPVISPKSTLRRQAKVNNNVLLPRFYYPLGRPNSKEQLEATIQRITAVFQQLPNCQATREHFATIAKACGCPLYWKMILFIAAGGEKVGYVSMDIFLEFWKNVISNFHDEASRFVHLLTVANPSGAINRHPRTDNNSNFSTQQSGRIYLVPEDFVPLVQDVVDTHPGLTFLKEAAEFHSRYVHTVIARIYYNVNRSWSGQITLPELRHSNLLSTIRLLEEEEDINQITDYFSYEHFYVIYCKFWELDKDHDLFIDKKDLTRHNDHAISSRMIDRIFSGAVTRGASQNKLAKFTSGNANNTNINNPRMSYTEFVWFLISEEDKRHPTAIEYWFRCMDLDGDGYLSMYELEYFYEEQLQRMESLGIETLPFEDCLCQMLDMIRPAIAGKISLTDLKRCQMTPIFFDTFFNLEKYLDHEQRDPFASQRDPDSEAGEEILKISDWDRYAAEEYELLVAEEGGPDHNDDMFMREEMVAEDGNSLPLMEGVLESDSSYVTHPLHNNLFSVTPCSIEYQY